MENRITHQVGAMLTREGNERARDGSRIVSERTGTAYTLENVAPNKLSATFRRAVPKIRGKKARKAARAARRAQGILV